MTDKNFSFEGLVHLGGAADAAVCGPDGCTPAEAAADAGNADDDSDDPDRPTHSRPTNKDKAALSRR